MSGTAIGRLSEERKAWRKDHPIGFIAQPTKNADGSLNLKKWECKIPGRKGTSWEGGLYPMKMVFSDDYPKAAPVCLFDVGFFHPNIFTNGNVCYSLLQCRWRPAVTIKEILLGIQELFNEPNPHSPANREVNVIFVQNKAEYDRRIKEQAVKYKNNIY